MPVSNRSESCDKIFSLIIYNKIIYNKILLCAYDGYTNDINRSSLLELTWVWHIQQLFRNPRFMGAKINGITSSGEAILSVVPKGNSRS